MCYTYITVKRKGEKKMSAKTMSIINNKGGVGKTTSTAILSELLAYLNKKVLVIDLDEQSNLSMLFSCYVEDTKEVVSGIENPVKGNIAELFKFRTRKIEQVKQFIVSTPIKGISMIPSSARHKNTISSLKSNETGNNNIVLKKALDTIKDEYDFILIDNAPASDILTVNSMFASDKVIIPVRVEQFSYKGLTETLNNILYIKDEHGLDYPEFAGAFITQAEPNTNVFKDLTEAYKEQLGDKFLKTFIRKDIKISEIETNFKPILEYNANTNAVFDYAELLLELDILDFASAQTLKNSIRE